MSEPKPPSPSRRDRSLPLQLVGFAFVIAVFTGLIVLLGSRELMSALIFTGIAFIAALVLLAMFALIEPGTGEHPPGNEPVLKPKPPRPHD